MDQGIEHSAGASFAPNPQYFDPENIVKLAIEGGCNAVASTFGVLGTVARKYAHKIPFIVKINHNELLTLPNKFDQVLFGTVKEAHNLGAVAVGATIYFGSDESTRQITEISEAFAQAHELGMAHDSLVLHSQLRIQDSRRRHARVGRSDRPGKSPGRDDSGRHHQAKTSGKKWRLHGGGKSARQVVRQNQQTRLRKTDHRQSDRSGSLSGGQLLHGPCGLINSGGESKGASDLAEAVRTAVINKRGGGTGLISGRKAFQRPMSEGVELLNAIQDVYLSDEITVA